MSHATYGSASAHKLLTDNRDRYIRQSANTRDNQVAPLPPRSQAERYAYTEALDGREPSDDTHWSRT